MTTYFSMSGRRGVHLIVGALVCVIATGGALASARAEEALPDQEKGLARALENHPDIVAAKAKVALVEAELYGKRIEVSRQVLGLYSSLKLLDAQISAAKVSLIQSKSELERTKSLLDSGQGDQATKEKAMAAVQAAEGKLVEATGRRDQAEKELRLLVGDASRVVVVDPPKAEAVPARQNAQPQMLEKWEAAAGKPIKVSLSELPLAEVMRFFSEKSGIMFTPQRHVLENFGMTLDSPISLDTSEVSLRAALQGFEDAYPELQFVLRDYGVLLTTKDYAEEHGYTPILDIEGR